MEKKLKFLKVADILENVALTTPEVYQEIMGIVIRLRHEAHSDLTSTSRDTTTSNLSLSLKGIQAMPYFIEVNLLLTDKCFEKIIIK